MPAHVCRARESVGEQIEPRKLWALPALRVARVNAKLLAGGKATLEIVWRECRVSNRSEPGG